MHLHVRTPTCTQLVKFVARINQTRSQFACKSTRLSVSTNIHTFTYIQRCEKTTRVVEPVLYSVHVSTAFDHNDLHIFRITIELYEIWTL